MKIFKIKWLLSLTVIFMLSSCLYEDRGNYNYKQINDLTIEDIDDLQVFDLVAGADSLKFTPKITYANDQNPTDDKYEYEWLIMPKDNNETSEVISNEKNLKWKVAGKEGVYVGQFKMRDKVADLTWSKHFFFKISSTTTSGWMVLCDQDGRARVDMIGIIGEKRHVVARDLLKGAEAVGRPIGMAFAYAQTVLVTAGNNETIIYGENGTFSVSKEFTTDESFNYKNEFSFRPSRTDVRAYARTWTRESKYAPTYIIDNSGDLFVRYYNELGATYGVKKNSDPKDRTKYLKLAPHIGFKWAKGGGNLGGPNATTLVYDTEGRSLYQLNYGTDYLDNVSFTEDFVEGWTVEKWGINQTPPTLNGDLIYMGSTYYNDVTSYTYAVVKDPATSKVYLYGVELLPNQKVKPILYKDITDVCPQIADAKTFAFTNIYSHMYYAVGNTLYCYNFKTNAPIAFYKKAEYANEKIVAIGFHAKIGWTRSEPWEINDQYKLVVATNKNLGGDVTIENRGVVRVYDNLEWANQDLKLLEQYNDLGNIISITHREKQL